MGWEGGSEKRKEKKKECALTRVKVQLGQKGGCLYR